MRDEHFAVGIAAPIGARDLHQLEGVADLAGRGHVRAAAEVEPVALLVDLDLLVCRDGVDQLDLEHLALVAEHALGLVARPDLLGEGFVARDDLAHLLLDRGEVFRRERLVAEEVVVEAVLDHRPDGDLRARPQRSARPRPAHARRRAGSAPARAGRRGVRNSILASRSIGSARSASAPSSAMATVRLASEGEMPLAMSRPVMPLGIVPTCAVGKGQRDHRSLLLLTRCLRMQVSVAGRSWMAGVSVRATPSRALKCKRGHDLYDGPKRCNDCIAELLAPSARSRRRGVDGIIGPAPAPVAPGQVPARMVRQRCRHEIEARRPERMAAARAAPGSSTHRPTGRSDRSPRRHSSSMSADAGIRARSVAERVWR